MGLALVSVRAGLEPRDVIEAAADVAALRGAIRPHSRTPATPPSDCRATRQAAADGSGRTRRARSAAAVRRDRPPSRRRRRQRRASCGRARRACERPVSIDCLSRRIGARPFRRSPSWRRHSTIGETIVRIDVARHLDQRAHRLGLEVPDLETPGLGRVDEPPEMMIARCRPRRGTAPVERVCFVLPAISFPPFCEPPLDGSASGSRRSAITSVLLQDLDLVAVGILHEEEAGHQSARHGRIP